MTFYRRLHATKDERSLIKTLPIRVRIFFNVCQEHLTGFHLINQLQADWMSELKPSNDHHKH